MAEHRLLLTVGPLALRLVTNCDRMAQELSGSAYTRAMLPASGSAPDLGQEVPFTLVIWRGERTRLQCQAAEARFEFHERGPGDNQQVYFEVLFFLQTLAARLLLERHNLFLLKAAVVEVAGTRWLVAGPPGSGKSTLLAAALALAPAGEPARYLDGKVLLDATGAVQGGSAGLAPRLEPGSGLPRKRRDGAPPPPAPVAGSVEACLFPVVAPFAPPELLEVGPDAPFRATGRLLAAASFYAESSHNHLAFFGEPLPFLDTAALAARRHRLAVALAGRPCFRAFGHPGAMALWLRKRPAVF